MKEIDGFCKKHFTVKAVALVLLISIIVDIASMVIGIIKNSNGLYEIAPIFSKIVSIFIFVVTSKIRKVDFTGGFYGILLAMVAISVFMLIYIIFNLSKTIMAIMLITPAVLMVVSIIDLIIWARGINKVHKLF